MVGDWDEVARRRAREASRASPEDRALQLELLRLAADVGGRRVLELGCGTGALARRMAERGAQVLALDASPEAIDTALEDARELEPAGRLEFGVADPHNRASLPSGPFDLVVLVEAVPGEALRHAAHVVRRGGRLLLAVPHPTTDQAAQQPGALQTLFGRIRKTGLRVIDVAESGPYLALLTERPRRRSRR